MSTLFTAEELSQLRCNGQATNHGRDWPPVTRLVLPSNNSVWLLTEILPAYNERFGYGLADYGTGQIHEGYIDLAALQVMAEPLYGVRYRVRRDEFFAPLYPVSVYWLASLMFGFLTDDPAHLEDAVQFLHEQQQNIITQLPTSAAAPALKLI